MLSFAEDRLYEILRSLTCTCPGSSPPLKLQLPLGQILEPFGVSADIVNEYDAFFVTDVRVILKEAATAADDVELCQTFPESVNAEPSDDFLRITCGDRPDFLTDLIMPACTAAPEHRLDHAFQDILRVKAAELSPDFTHANGHAVLFCGNALFDWLPVHDAHDIHGSVANIDEHIFAGHITGMKHGSVPLRENEDLPDMDPVVLSPEIKFGIDVLHEIFAEFIFLPGDPGKRKTCRQDYICIAEAPHIEFFRDGCQRQDEKIAANMTACTVEELEHVSEEDLREAARASQQTISQRFSENMTKEMLEAYRQNCIANGLDVICDFNGLSASFLSMMEKDLDLHISLEINDDKRLEDYITYDEETMLISPWDVKEVVVTALRISRKTDGQNEVRIPVADYREFQNNITSICGLLYNTLEKQSGTVPDGQEGKVWRA